MDTYTLRLHPNQDLKQALEQVIKEQKFQAACIVTCVGSLSSARLRMADGVIIKDFECAYEIVSLVGTLSQDGVHLHLIISDKEGNCFGGHLKKGCIINTTAEIVIGVLKNTLFSRVLDQKTSYKELIVK